MAAPSFGFPERFLVCREADFNTLYAKVTANYWYTWGRDRGYYRLQDTDQFRRVAGALAAVDWCAGLSPFPPGFVVPVERSRDELARVSWLTEAAITAPSSRWEQYTRGQVQGIEEYVEAQAAIGARTVYSFVLGQTRTMPWDSLLPEQIREAQTYWRQGHAGGATQAA